MSGDAQLMLMIAGMHLLGLVCAAVLIMPALRDGPEFPPRRPDRAPTTAGAAVPTPRPSRPTGRAAGSRSRTPSRRAFASAITARCQTSAHGASAGRRASPIARRSDRTDSFQGLRQRPRVGAPVRANTPFAQTKSQSHA